MADKGLKGYADHDTGSESRRLAWALRTVSVVCVLEAFALAALAFGVAALMPLKTVQPMLLLADDRNNQIIEVSPFKASADGFRLMTEVLVRKFVSITHTVVDNAAAMQEQWGEILYNMSSTEVFELLRDTFAEPANALLRDNVARGVEIDGDPRLIDAQGEQLFYQIAFRTIDSRLTEVVRTRRWVATLIVEFMPAEVRYEDRYINPLGFRVVGYSVAVAGGPAVAGVD